jgi:hypothetical protein
LLRQTESPEWDKGYKKYRDDLGCPIKSDKRKEEVEWLLTYAIRLEYTDEGKYNSPSFYKYLLPFTIFIFKGINRINQSQKQLLNIFA